MFVIIRWRQWPSSGAYFCALAGATGWLQFSWCKTDYLMSGRLLDMTQINTDCGKIALKFKRVFHSTPSYFLNNRVSHVSTSNSSSGEQISGHPYPSPSTICLTLLRVNGLFRWVKFHVTTTSIPLTAATAT